MIRLLAPLLLLACAKNAPEPAPEAPPEPAPEAPATDEVPPDDPEAAFSGPSQREVEGDLAVTLSVDKERYLAKANTIRCITTPCPSNGRPALAQVGITLENVGSAPVTLTFPSSQRFELTLLDPEGEIVRSWAADKMFMMQTATLELAPGQRERWAADLPIAALDNVELAGDFVIRGRVLEHGPVVELPVHVDLEGDQPL